MDRSNTTSLFRHAARFALAAILVAGCTDEPTRSAAQPIVVCANGSTLTGVDVSVWDNTVNWDQVAAGGITFAFIRVSDGLYQDTQFARNWSEAHRVGVLRGVYQFFRAGTDPIQQADLMISMMGTLAADDLSPVADVEQPDGQTPDVMIANLRIWIDHVRAVTGRTPLIYTGLYSWPTLTNSSPDFVSNPLWVAQWGPMCPDLPDPWMHWAFWQTHGDSATVPGISNPCDLDVFNGTRDQMLAVAGGTPVCGDGWCVAGEETTCASDCPPCASVPAAGRIVDESEACFLGGGDAQYLRQVTTAGWDNTLVWTHTTNSTSPANYGIWFFDFDEAGTYALDAYTASPWAQSTQAVYRVRHDGATDNVTLNQTSVDGWNPLGQFQFASGGDQWIRLNDNTGESGTLMIQLVFDAIRITRVDGGADGGVSDASGDVPGDVDAASDVEAASETGADAVDAIEAAALGDASVESSVRDAAPSNADAGAHDVVGDGGPSMRANGCACSAPGRSQRSGQLALGGLAALFAACARRTRRARDLRAVLTARSRRR